MNNLKTYIVDIDYDSSVSTYRRRVVCMADNYESAVTTVKSSLEKNSYDSISIISVKEFEHSDIIIGC